MYDDEGAGWSDLYSEEPLYQTYHDIATARALVVQSGCFSKYLCRAETTGGCRKILLKKLQFPNVLMFGYKLHLYML